MTEAVQVLEPRRGRRRKDRRNAKRDGKLLASLAEGYTVASACTVAGYQRRTVFGWRKKDKGFAALFDAAVEEGTDVLEDEARRRALQGVDEPVFYKGEECGVVRKYSDTLLIFLLNGRRPEKFKQRGLVEHVGAGGGPIQHEDVNVREWLADRIAGVATRTGQERDPKRLN